MLLGCLPLLPHTLLFLPWTGWAFAALPAWQTRLPRLPARYSSGCLAAYYTAACLPRLPLRYAALAARCWFARSLLDNAPLPTMTCLPRLAYRTAMVP